MFRKPRTQRDFMKSVFGSMPPGASDQSLGKPQPPLELPHAPDAVTTRLPTPQAGVIQRTDVYDCIRHRRSRRHFGPEALTLDQLSFLLWATQGVDEVLGENYATLRPSPSGGARHPFETYLAVSRVIGLEPGLYRYLPLSHQLLHLGGRESLREEIAEAVFGQRFVADGALVFFWACVPYRGEWRYTEAAHKVMLLDAGHLCQNLYIACEAIGAGTTAVGAYDQDAADKLLGLDGEDEFVVYLAPVGIPAGNGDGESG